MKTFSVGAVRYLNSLPLIHSLDRLEGVRLVRAVPAELLALLESDAVDLALCPVIDVQTSRRDLVVVPAGAIGSAANTLTVRLFSRVPLPTVRHLHIDGDSHTSAALAQVLFARNFGYVPAVHPLPSVTDLAAAGEVEAALLIGDKVVTAEPAAETFPHQMDLGGAWRRLTGLPFVFATWLTPAGTFLGDLPEILARTRAANLDRIDGLVGDWARAHAWPEGLALTYLRDVLDFSMGERQLAAVERFWRECSDLGLIGRPRPLTLYDPESHA